MTTLYYIHDPMCSWCWGFSRTLTSLLEALPSEITVVRLLGGLAADSDSPMPMDMQQRIAETWRHIEATIPGVKFNFDFWNVCQPRRSTYPACRAVIAARRQREQFDLRMTRAIQRAYYQEARNPSDESTLIELANELSLNVETFRADLHNPSTQLQLSNEIEMVRQIGVDSFPSLVLKHNNRYQNIPVDYNDHQTMLALIQNITY